MSKKRRQKQTKKRPNPDALFGELRAVLQRGKVDAGQRIHIIGLCARMHKHYPERYQSVWLPYLESYRLHWQPEELRVSNHAELKQAVRLIPFSKFTLSLDYNTPDMKMLFNSKELSAVQNVQLRYSIFALHHVLESKTLTSLKALHFEDNHTSVFRVLNLLANSRHRDTLAALSIRAAREHDEHVYRLTSEIASFKALNNLSLRGSDLTNRGIRALTHVQIFKNLEHLNLEGCHLTDDAIGYMADALGKLKSLNLNDLHLSKSTTHGLQNLLEAPQLRGLESLSLAAYSQHTPPIDLFVTLSEFRFPQLRHLDLSRNKLDDATLQTLAQCDHMQALRTLDLSGVMLSDDMANLLATHSFFARLDELGINPQHVEASHARALAHSDTLKPHLAERFASLS